MTPSGAGIRASGHWLPLASIASLLLIWAVAAALAQSRLLPGPMAVLGFVAEEIWHGEMLWHLSATLLRVMAAFTVAMFAGIVIGILKGRSGVFDSLFNPWLIVLLNIPALVTIILAYVWIGLTEAAAILAIAINKIPNVVVIIREGSRALNNELDEMARAFTMRPIDRLRHVILPQLQPYVASAARSGIALIWKIVLVVELLGRPNGVGFQLYLYFQLFDVKGILGYSLVFSALMLLIELTLVQRFERYATRWRGRTA